MRNILSSPAHISSSPFLSEQRSDDFLITEEQAEPLGAGGRPRLVCWEAVGRCGQHGDCAQAAPCPWGCGHHRCPTAVPRHFVSPGTAPSAPHPAGSRTPPAWLVLVGVQWPDSAGAPSVAVQPGGSRVGVPLLDSTHVRAARAQGSEGGSPQPSKHGHVLLPPAPIVTRALRGRGLGGAQRQRGRAPRGTRSPKPPWPCPMQGGEGGRVGASGDDGGMWGRELGRGAKAAAVGAA